MKLIKMVCVLIIAALGYYLLWPDIVRAWNQVGLGITIIFWLSQSLLLFILWIAFFIFIKMLKLLSREEKCLKEETIFPSRKELLWLAVGSVFLFPSAIGIAKHILSGRFQFMPTVFVISAVGTCCFLKYMRWKRKTA
ncbi:hypothetical protein P378_00220 [Desulforamulus profundi]|uniref:Uncharacterized protein n=1 Tax=Desulforamulus profundi TaxID=1383067 RepID=A0A2C6LMY7_9FIRM|nr:hypothetical protein [Desulforamulus profundi]PHJ39980.1 hypothetical protein P378_00220 [Desulforamulus profundi]